MSPRALIEARPHEARDIMENNENIPIEGLGHGRSAS
jgi:hypothetical protein